DHLAGSLSADVEGQLRQHLEDCKGCRTELSDLRALWNDLAEAPVPQMAGSRIRAVVLEAATDLATHTWKWMFDMKHILKAFAAILVLAALAAGASLLLGRKTTTPSDSVDAL